MGNEWGEAYRVLNEQKDAGKSQAELWEEKRLAHWKLMRAAWTRWQDLVKEHHALGYDAARNPFETD